ncbi:hypothetical protein A3K62_00750 [Candidatus Pacearchaeota archaeon RBG_16_35_8]|nr:MAG: hypothetical protein A3K62_00750 [Candidatus Pacearchaeota archaeon RBG_16_35_8]
MKQIILDTSFIISCVKQKIDFFEKLNHEGMRILVPEQVIDELMGLGADTALKILEINEFKIVKMAGKDGDEAILKIAKKDPDLIVATLDRDLQKKMRNRKMIIRGMKNLEIL